MMPQDSQMVAPNSSPRDLLLSVETYLNPALLEPARIDTVRAHLSAGSLVVIRDAFHPAFAERMFRCLDECTAWKLHEFRHENFHYHHHNLYDKRDYPDDLVWCERVFDSPASRAFASRVSGRRCTGSTICNASWYQSGDHSLPHNDGGSSAAGENRQVAFVWHLAKEWRPEWGGALYWCPRSMYLPPQFNSLILFNIGQDSHHLVTMVTPDAQGKRPDATTKESGGRGYLSS
jgi:hypothetical protein